MIRNNFALSSVCGGISGPKKPINSTMTLMLELKKNPVLQEKLMALMGNTEIMNLVSDPGAIHEVMSFFDRMDPEFLKTLPALAEQMGSLM